MTREDFAKEALFDGCEARHEGQTLENNPEALGSRAYGAWQDGWLIENAEMCRRAAVPPILDQLKNAVGYGE